MKLKFIVQSLTATMLLTGCASAVMMGSGAFQDDLYFDNRKPVTASRQSSDTSMITSQDIASYGSRVGQYADASDAQVDSRDFGAAQKYYSAQNSKVNVAEDAELIYEAEDSLEYSDGYWLGGFNGSSMDQSYAERMVRFHGPFVGAAYYSTPFLYYASTSSDWNVYIENDRAYYVPSWTNPFYDDFYYGSAYSWRRYNFYMGHYSYYGWPYTPWDYHYSYYWHNGYYSPHSWAFHHLHHHYNHYYSGYPGHYYYPGGHHGGVSGNRYHYGSRGNSISVGGSNINTRPSVSGNSRGNRAQVHSNRTATSGRAYRSSDNHQQRSTYTRPSASRSQAVRGSEGNASHRVQQSSSTRSGSTYTPSSSRSVRSSQRVGSSSSRPRSYGQSGSTTNSYTPSRSTRQATSSSRDNSSYNNSSRSSSSGSYSGGRSSGSSSGGSRSAGSSSGHSSRTR